MDKEEARAFAAARNQQLPQYDLSSFAHRHRISVRLAKDILERAGGSRAAADRLVARSKPAEDGNESNWL